MHQSEITKQSQMQNVTSPKRSKSARVFIQYLFTRYLQPLQRLPVGALSSVHNNIAEMTNTCCYC